jgi:phospholipid/cholesterol/gamma-HCH transport system permease protein
MTRSSLVERAARAVGRPAIAAARATRDLWLVLVGVLAGVIRSYRPGGRRPPGALLEQLYVIGNRSLVFVAVTLGFIGMVMMYQACLQFSRAIGDLSQVGVQFLRLVVSDFGPTLTAMMLATRVGAGIAAEIGSMKVTEQLDALRMSGVLPIDYLLVPRFVASIVMTDRAVHPRRGDHVRRRRPDRAPVVRRQPAHVLRPGDGPAAPPGAGPAQGACYGAAIPIVAGFCGLRPARLRGRRLGHHRGGGRQLVRGDRARLRAVGRRAVALRR